MKISLKLGNSSVLERYIPKASVSIGRSDRADFPVKDEALSRLHCLVELEDGEFFITDLNSTNGVTLDGNRITQSIKTPFNTFMQLSIGPFECIILDEEEKEVNFTVESGLLNKHRTSPIKVSSKTKQISNAKTSKFKPIYLIAPLLIFGGWFFFLSENDEFSPEKISELITKRKEVIENKRTVLTPNKFSSMAIYESLEAKKNCKDLVELCNEFKISEEAYQGIVIDNREAYVFMQPSVFFNSPKLNYLNEVPNAEALMGHYITLKSSLMDKMDKQEIDQVHLLLINKDNKITKIYRYHVNVFGDSIERFRIIENLGNAFLSRELEDVAKALEATIPSQEYKTI
jgi:hypothetical protein